MVVHISVLGSPQNPGTACRRQKRHVAVPVDDARLGFRFGLVYVSSRQSAWGFFTPQTPRHGPAAAAEAGDPGSTPGGRGGL